MRPEGLGNLIKIIHPRPPLNVYTVANNGRILMWRLMAANQLLRHLKIVAKKSQDEAFEVPTAGVMSAAIFWDGTSWSSNVNRRFGGTHYIHLA
jgi:hypothetical protein